MASIRFTVPSRFMTVQNGWGCLCSLAAGPPWLAVLDSPQPCSRPQPATDNGVRDDRLLLSSTQLKSCATNENAVGDTYIYDVYIKRDRRLRS